MLHHIINRGIERRAIFKDDFDRENFIEHLSTLVPETQTICYAWVLMPNHAEFLLRSGSGDVAHLMRRLLTGLIRSLGGWAASKRLRLKGQDRLKGDERILEDSDFVTSILAEANEKLDRFYEIKSQGYTIEKVEKRVMEIFGGKKDVIYSKGRRRIQVAAKSLLCYWAVHEPGLTATELVKRLRMTQPAVSYAVIRRELIAKEKSYTLVK